MKKNLLYFILSITAFIIGLICMIFAFYQNPLPASGNSALLIFSTCCVIIGLCAAAVYYRKYMLIKQIYTERLPRIAHWTLQAKKSNLVKSQILESQSHTRCTSFLILILSIIFCIVFAYSGGHFVLLLGYALATFSLLIFIVAQRFISSYYLHLLTTPIDVIFTDNFIYFMDNLFSVNKALYYLEKMELYIGRDSSITFKYGHYDVDDPEAFHLIIPVPNDQIQSAVSVKAYYNKYVKH